MKILVLLVITAILLSALATPFVLNREPVQAQGSTVTFAVIASTPSESRTRRNKPGLLKKVFSWRNITVS